MIVPLTPLEFKVRAADLYGDRTCLVDGDQRFTFAEFDERTNRLANAVREAGVERGAVASVLSLNSHHVMEGYYGIVQAGAVFNPLNPGFGDRGLENILNQTASPLLIFHAAHLPLVEALRPELAAVKRFVVIDPPSPVEWATEYEVFVEAAPATPGAQPDGVDENAVAELFFNYRAPHGLLGIQLTHRALYLHALENLISQHITDADRLLHVIPIYDGNGWGAPQFMVAAGGCQVLIREIDIDRILRLVQDEQITRLYIIPRLLSAIMRHPTFGYYDVSSLTHIVLGGAAFSRDLVEEAEMRFGCRVIGGYGVFETGPVVSYACVKEHLAASRDLRIDTQATSGLPLIGVRIRVVGEDGCDVPRDGRTPGAILIRCNHVMSGYFNRPDITADRIVDGWYHSGDMAVVNAEGYLTLVDAEAATQSTPPRDASTVL